MSQLSSSGNLIHAWLRLRLWIWLTYWAALIEGLIGVATLTAVGSGNLTLRCIQRVVLARQRLEKLMEAHHVGR